MWTNALHDSRLRFSAEQPRSVTRSVHRIDLFD
jgi:hypothetical protein